MIKFTNIVVALFFCCLTLLLSGCGGSGSHQTAASEPASFALNTDTTFQVGETRRIENTDTTIKLDAVTDNPRCHPCFGGGGVVSVRLLISDSAKKNDAFVVPLYDPVAVSHPIIPATGNRPAYVITSPKVEPNNGPGGKGNTEKNLSRINYKITLRVVPQP